MNKFTTRAITLAYTAGSIIRKNFKPGLKRNAKKDTSPVTVFDRSINDLVIRSLHTAFPSHSIIGEEKSYKANSEYVWLCDPIDGTIPFTSGVPLASFSLALTMNGVPITGVVYDPFMDRLFVAEKGKGTFLNRRKIRVTKNRGINSHIFYAGWWKHSLYDLVDVRRNLTKKGAKIMDFCSFAYAGSLVAAGEFTGLIFADRFPWDVAAIKILIEEAGGVCTDLKGNNQRYDQEVNGFVAANKEIHTQLVRVVKKYLKKNAHTV